MIKIFYSSAYNVRHENINVNNATKLLKHDIRSKIIGDVNKFIYGSDGVIIKGNKNVLYLGGFYYEKNKYLDNKYGDCENTVRCELEQIDNSDIVFVSLLKYSSIASVTEMIYASFKNKKIVIFCDKNITQFKVEYEYWFSIITCMLVNSDIEIVYVNSEKEIIDYINNLKEEKI